jgi:putative hydrolase of the HAD superfamily
MPYSTLFIDLDDTVYPAQSGLWDLIKDRISLYMHERLKLDWSVIPAMRTAYFLNYGTTMRGLMADFSFDREDYLHFVHNVPLGDFIQPDYALQQALDRLPYRKVIFTNADTPHAERVLNILGIASCFKQIIDINAIHPHCKPLPAAYLRALELSGENDPCHCVFMDDSISNLSTAKQLGFYTVRVGNTEPSQAYDAAILKLHDAASVLPC